MARVAGPAGAHGRLPAARALLRRCGAALGLLACVTPAALHAQGVTLADSAAVFSARTVRAVRLTGPAPVVDGVLDEAVWGETQPATDFLQKDPAEGRPATLRTEVRFCYDGKDLYIGAVMHTRGPGTVQSTMSRRDDPGSSERLIISYDTYHDRRTAYTLGVTASGVRFDYFHPTDEEYDRDYSFDPVWEARTTLHDSTWVAEMRIPFSQFRFNAADAQVWGLNIDRWVPTLNEDQYWVLVPKKVTGFSSRMGSLVGIEGITPSRRLELTPYAAGQLHADSRVPEEDPFNEPLETHFNAGLDLKMGLGPNLTLDATVNPDFGQIEADPAVVNLTVFEPYFEEKRPFFIEGNDLMSGGGENYYYSRRIGAPPHYQPWATYSDVPEYTTILTAGKVTGRLPGGLSIGGLAALTAAEEAEMTVDSIANVDSGTTLRRAAHDASVPPGILRLAGSAEDPSYEGITTVEAEPLTAYGVLRMQQEFGPGPSTCGLTLTGVGRSFSGESPVRDILARQAVSGGVDWDLRFDHGLYELSGHAGFSAINGSPEALLRVQQTSAHYYQRPDADYVEVDPARTTMEGYTLGLSMAKNGGEHWLWGVEGGARSPGLELNDLGRLTQADQVGGNGVLIYRETVPGDLFHSYLLQLDGAGTWNFGGVNLGVSAGGHASLTWRNFWTTTVGANYAARAENMHMTRGGPLIGTGWWQQAHVTQTGNPAAPIAWSVFMQGVRDELGGWLAEADLNLSARFGDRVTLGVNPSWTREVNARQYVSTVDGGGALTYGRRYVFAFIDRVTTSMQLRLSYAFTPDLTLDVYAEPFAASGDYYDEGELPAAGSRDLRVYGTDGTTITRNDDGSATVTDGADSFTLPNRDFQVLSFRSNVVLRWEWLRGSTLYLVWQQDRGDYTDTGAHVRAGDMFSSVNSPGADVLALKISYWLPVP